MYLYDVEALLLFEKQQGEDSNHSDIKQIDTQLDR